MFKQVPFYRPFDYSEVRYLSPGEKTPRGGSEPKACAVANERHA